MPSHHESGRGGARTALWLNLIGLAGLACVVWAVAGLVRSLASPGTEATAVGTVAAPRRAEGASPSYYPLEVGRFWVYRSEDPAQGVVTEVERRIVRRESRPGQDLFFFADGTMAYVHAGKVFEVGSGGGVNVIPVDAEDPGRPYVYRSQGLHIEKHIGAVDTAVVLGGRRYEGCIAVITRFRPQDQIMAEPRSYTSYYARGVGLVGREQWLRAAADGPSTVLRDYGVNSL